jgi:putative transposase
MRIRRMKHAVYDLKYHLACVPKYRKNVLSKEVSEYLNDIFIKIAEEYESGIDTMEVMENHVYVFVEVPPRYSPTRVVQIIKSVSAREVFSKYPDFRKQL